MMYPRDRMARPSGRTDRITRMEHEVLLLVADGRGDGQSLAEDTGRSREGCHQTAASLARKGWVYREQRPTRYTLTREGQIMLSRVEAEPGLVTS